MKKFEIKLKQRNIADEELLRDLIKLSNHLDKKNITKIEYDECGYFGATTFLRRFGTWNNALKLAGLHIKNRQNIPLEELFENIIDVWEKIGKQPVGSDLEKSKGISRFSISTYEKRFGSWNKALLLFSEYVNNNKIIKEETNTQNNTIRKNLLKKTKRKINWRIRAQVLIRDSCICKMCGSSPSKNPETCLHVDHIIPWSKGGETIIDNLQTLCSICNIGKSDLILK